MTGSRRNTHRMKWISNKRKKKNEVDEKRTICILRASTCKFETLSSITSHLINCQTCTTKDFSLSIVCVRAYVRVHNFSFPSTFGGAMKIIAIVSHGSNDHYLFEDFMRFLAQTFSSQWAWGLSFGCSVISSFFFAILPFAF